MQSSVGGKGREELSLLVNRRSERGKGDICIVEQRRVWHVSGPKSLQAGRGERFR